MFCCFYIYIYLLIIFLLYGTNERMHSHGFCCSTQYLINLFQCTDLERSFILIMCIYIYMASLSFLDIAGCKVVASVIFNEEMVFTVELNKKII